MTQNISCSKDPDLNETHKPEASHAPKQPVGLLGELAACTSVCVIFVDRVGPALSPRAARAQVLANSSGTFLRPPKSYHRTPFFFPLCGCQRRTRALPKWLPAISA